MRIMCYIILQPFFRQCLATKNERKTRINFGEKVTGVSGRRQQRYREQYGKLLNLAHINHDTPHCIVFVFFLKKRIFAFNRQLAAHTSI